MIDPNLDFASYYKDYGDPDRTCERLYDWHRALWGRAFPGIDTFQLDVVWTGHSWEIALRVVSGPPFRLGSDGIIPTWSSPKRIEWFSRFSPELAAEIVADRDDFYRVASTIGGYILFPRNRAGQTGQTINQARGTSPKIQDRFDLTLECIRRHYDDHTGDNPLGERLAYYGDFFALFGDGAEGFDSYVTFFLLDDLVSNDRRAVLSLMSGEPITEFAEPAYAVTAPEYARYRQRSLDFVMARNNRIRQLNL